ncbi:MAG TPA: flagellar hook-basal body complex protein FliE [Nitrospiraceae bacterium]|nr:flagellar hook-basal body complex protein FliE [Nitrospiraceae bacterium]
MDKIAPLSSALSPIAEPAPFRPAAAEGQGGVEFQGALRDAIASINEVQQGASQAVEALATGQSQNIHQAMIALQQADISFQLMMQIRNKLVTAYEEIQRMQI